MRGSVIRHGTPGTGLFSRAVFLLIVLVVICGCGLRHRPVDDDLAQEDAGADGTWWQQMPHLSSMDLTEGERLHVVATTSIVADVVYRVGGDRIELATLVGLGTDPHAFQPTPQDAAMLADADVVFASGGGLETFLEDLLQSAGGAVPVVPVSYGLDPQHLQDVGHVSDEQDSRGDVLVDGEPDPHTWFDPNNVIVWIHNIEQALSVLDPEGAKVYRANAEAYRTQLEALDAWIEDQVALVPASDRVLITDHAVLAYFAARYGFEQGGAILPGFSTVSQPSARDLAALESAIQAWDVKAIFVGQMGNPDLAARVASDTGVALVPLYTGSLSEPDGPAGDYISFMRYNTSAIVQALR